MASFRARKESHSRETDCLVAGAVLEIKGDGDDLPREVWIKSNRSLTHGHRTVVWLKT